MLYSYVHLDILGYLCCFVNDAEYACTVHTHTEHGEEYNDVLDVNICHICMYCATYTSHICRTATHIFSYARICLRICE